MGLRERREREKFATRQSILDAARDLFVAKGYEAVTMREIAGLIEYSPTAIYFHFKDKQSLLQEICMVDYLTLAKSFERIAKIADPLERLRKLGLAYVQFAVDHPNHYRLMFMTPYPAAAYEDDKSLAFKDNPDKDAYALLKNTIAEAIQKRLLRKELQDADLIAQMTWAAVHGIASLHIAKANDPWVTWRPVKKIAQAMVEAQIRGLIAGKEKTRG